jgi:hypothetical protein
MAAMTRLSESSAQGLLAFELGSERGRSVSGLAPTSGCGRCRLAPWRWLTTEIAAATKRFALAVEATVVSSYEAGREGFWLHRYLVADGTRATSWIPRVLKSTGRRGGPRPIRPIWAGY